MRQAGCVRFVPGWQQQDSPVPAPAAQPRTCQASGAPAGFPLPFTHPGWEPRQSREALNCVKEFKSGGGKLREAGQQWRGRRRRRKP